MIAKLIIVQPFDGGCGYNINPLHLGGISYFVVCCIVVCCIVVMTVGHKIGSKHDCCSVDMQLVFTL